MNVKIGELVEYVEVLKARQDHKVKRLNQIVHDLVRIKEELEKELDGQAQVLDNLEKQVKVAGEVALQAANDAKKEIGERLKQHYGFSTEGLRGVGVL